MYYGRGAGKLPTASAVVSDVIDCAKHGRKHIICIWEEEKLSLKSVEDASRKFFVRVSEGSEDAVKKLFGDVDKIEAEGITGEYGFVTPVMTEKEFAQKSAELPRIYQPDPPGRGLECMAGRGRRRNRGMNEICGGAGRRDGR